MSKVLEVCVGEQLYLQVIRPRLVEFKLLTAIKKEQEEEEKDTEDP